MLTLSSVLVKFSLWGPGRWFQGIGSVVLLPWAHVQCSLSRLLHHACNLRSFMTPCGLLRSVFQWTSPISELQDGSHERLHWWFKSKTLSFDVNLDEGKSQHGLLPRSSRPRADLPKKNINWTLVWDIMNLTNEALGSSIPMDTMVGIQLVDVRLSICDIIIVCDHIWVFERFFQYNRTPGWESNSSFVVTSTNVFSWSSSWHIACSGWKDFDTKSSLVQDESVCWFLVTYSLLSVSDLLWFRMLG